MSEIFIYGTLGYLPLLRKVLGAELRDMQITPARLPGWRVSAVAGEVYPMIAPDPTTEARGLLLSGLSGEAVARTDFYEALDGYRRVPVEVEQGAGAWIVADVYVPRDATVSLGAWRAEDWEARWGELSALAAEEVMDWHGKAKPEQVGRRYAMIATRAQARLNARDTPPTTQRRKAAPGDVEMVTRRRPYAHFFAIEEFELRHRRFDGKRSGVIERAAFVSADAATVLPYDPRRDRVMLVEQLRVGPYGRGDAQPWVLEPVAGRVDPGESPEDCAHREALEEAGLRLERLIRVAGYYPSPGAKTEFLHSFIGLADLPDTAAGLGGVQGEGEDIRAHVLPFDAAMALVASGEINVGTTLVSLLFLAAQREALKAG